jgi:hypothetical protein
MDRPEKEKATRPLSKPESMLAFDSLDLQGDAHHIANHQLAGAKIFCPA